MAKTKRIEAEDGTVIHIKKMPTDWKGVAAMVGALLAVLGFFWNKMESYSERERSDKVQEAAYVQLAEKLNQLYIKTEALEQVVHLLPSLLSKKPAKIDRAVRSVKMVLKAGKPKPPQPESVKSVDAGIPEKPVISPKAQREFPAAKLPSFQMVQEEAR